MDINIFYSHNLRERMSIVRRLGQFMSRIQYYGFYISLYVVEGKYVEVYYNRHNYNVEEIEILDPLDKKLNRYAAGVDFSDLFNAK